MTVLLTKLTVANFRSIRGEVTIPLDAPVILIHGRNGVGKTSLLSALELALTGDVSSLRRMDTHVTEFLLHKEEDSGLITLAANLGAGTASYTISAAGLDGQPILDANQSHFFNERCYLAQAALSKLLEIYQHQEKKSSQSALTKFVNDLLQLDQYDALIDGLFAAGNVRRLREIAPLYWEARERLDKIAQELLENLSQQFSLVDSFKAQQNKLQLPLDPNAKPEILLAQLDSLRESYSSQSRVERISFLSQLQHQLTVASVTLSRLEEGAGSGPIDRELEVALAVKAYDEWAAVWAAKLDQLVIELGQYVATSSAIASGDPVTKRTLALKVAETELVRLENLLVADEKANDQASKLSALLQAANARVAALDEQISAVSVTSGSLAEALSAIVPHIHGDECPVCSRNYSEISKRPLGAHVANKVASLIEAAGRLQALIQEKAGSATSAANAQRSLSTISAQVMQAAQRDEMKLRKARLAEIKVALDGMDAEVTRGISLIAARNAAVHGRETNRTQTESLVVARATLNNVTSALGQVASDAEGAPSQRAERLRLLLMTSIEQLSGEEARSASTLSGINELEGLAKRQIRLLEEHFKLTKLKLRLEEAKSKADAQIEVARSVSKAAKDQRAGIVRRVFNDDLNAVWKALFVRLAPDEDFVPAFALPKDNSGDVEAVLETHYRAGGKGGNPRAMLSAGNLNTAALTLFLSLHLSVRPTLPCLIIDDPVQSMDEVHISQFAALLRTLSKELGRQIVIAVHERSLFDYLALELSPAFPSDRLITVELERTVDGFSSVRWEMQTFEKDNAIAA